MIQALEADFSIEVKIKQDLLDATQGQLRAATRELAEQRRQIQLWQASCAELDQVQQRIRNVERAVTEEDGFAWVGSRMTEPDRAVEGGDDGISVTATDTTSRTTQAAGSRMEIEPMPLESDPAVPSSNTLASLIQLRMLKTWHSRIESVMNDRLDKLKGASAEKEFQCKKIVSLCTGVPLENVETVCQCSSPGRLQLLIRPLDARKPRDCHGK